MVRIVNWLLTRRCNMSCEYCGIVKVGGQKRISHFKKNEISTERVITLLDKFRIYNPSIFHIFYGGEPFLRGDLMDILRFCNDSEINYTVISNCSPDVQPKIMNVLKAIGWIKGFSASVDPSILTEPNDSHSQMKSSWGFHFLMKMKNYVDDVVAEITMTRPTLGHTYDLIKMLSSVNIHSSLTAIDINKNYNYDFSAYASETRLLKHNKYLDSVYEQIMSDDSLLIHMKDIVVPQLFRHIDSTYDCKLEDGIHNLTIDADGSIRLCLRINGHVSQNDFNDSNVLHKIGPYGYVLNPQLEYGMELDKASFCKGCNHTCVMMSKYINDTDDSRRITEH
jgi:MoaA/NifB/PqqE/SkfB family radical SAM enzyme